MTSSAFRDNAAQNRFELDVRGLTAWADYRRDGARLVIDHVESPVALRGTGAAGELMAKIASEARRGGVKIVPLCSYAAAWLQRSAENRDLIA